MKTSKIGKLYTSGVRPWLKNVACLSSLLSIRENDITILDYFTQIFLVRRKNDEYRDRHMSVIAISFKLTRPVKKLGSSCLCCQTLGGSCHPVVGRIFNSKIHISSGISNSIAYSSF